MRHRPVVRLALAIAALAFVVGAAAAQAPKAPPKRKLSGSERADAQELVVLADTVVKGKLTGGDAWLKWRNHFLKGADGKTYVPFTIEIDEAPADSFRFVAMYVRVTERGDTLASAERIKVKGGIGYRTGEVPVSVPERQFAPAGAPVAGENSAALRLAEESLRVPEEGAYPFEDFHFFELPGPAVDEPRSVRRALVVPAGSFDIYVAIRERGRMKGQAPRTAVIKHALDVPDFSKAGLQISSVIVADRLDSVSAPLDVKAQAERPYALGGAEIVPARDTIFNRDEELTIVFLIYNPATDAGGKPNVAVEYTFHQQVGVGEKLFNRTAPQLYSAQTLPPAFDVRVGHQLAPTQTVPLASFPPGGYRLEVKVTDQLASTSVSQDVRFVVDAPTEAGRQP